MPAGWPYFAWIDVGETTFQSEHMRWDEQVFSFTLAQEEGDPATLTAVVRRPQDETGRTLGLLGPGRKLWCWFALDTGAGLVKFRGRLVGIPTSIFEDLVTLEFVAKPVDLVAQKEALAETLRVLPYYDEVMIDEDRRDDPDVVLEGYTKVWHYDRETHIITVSDEIEGEDGLVEFDGASEGGKVLWDGLGLNLATGPLAQVDLTAEFNWTQQGQGTVDLTSYVINNGPHQFAAAGAIASYTLTADNWPKKGSGLGDGWEVADSSCYEGYDLTIGSFTRNGQITLEEAAGEGPATVEFNETTSTIPYTPPGSITVGNTVQSDWQTSYSEDGDHEYYPSSLTYNYSKTSQILPLHHIVPTLVAGYKAERHFTERVHISLVADVQPILTDPEDGEALIIDDVHSVDLSEAIDGNIPIGDPRRRSYIATERGNRSIEYLIVLARAHLMKRARAVEIFFAPKLDRMAEVTLRKNAFLIEPRVGEALGKIIAYSIALDGSDGLIKCEVRIGCTIGRGGSAVASGGEPTYCSIDYVGADYQQFTGRMILFDSSVGYMPPIADPNDDGINFLSDLSVDDVIEIPMVVEFPPEVQQTYVLQAIVANRLPFSSAESDEDQQQSSDQVSELVSNTLREIETKLIFKLKSMTSAFSTDYDIQVTDLKIPVGIDLEAATA